MKKEIYAVYSQADMTFVMEDTYNDNGDVVSTECVGFYYGEPDEKSTEYFVGKLKADFIWND